jgi:hypothetical protein
MDACLSRRRLPLLPPLLVAWIVALGLALATPARSAPGAIVRCTTPDGGSVYTDRACGLSGARPAPMSGALIARLVTEARVARDQGVDASLPLGVDATGAPTAPASLSARRPAADGCARSPHQLADDLRGSLVLGDVNRLAESYHWVGMRTREGRRTLDRLAHLLGHPAIDSQYFDAQVTSLADADGSGRGGDSGVLQLVLAGDGAPTVVEFDVRRYAGCYFVRFPSDGATIA